ncbi:MAG: homoserine O-acetyltransferase [Elusimicrobia bacterium]|nr:homoserine O-acetyltransferase [Elusimicrobiota bacterium]
MDRSIGFVETKFFHLKEPLLLESGEVLKNVRIAYETYGTLNKEKTNAILICHAFSGDAHAAGWHKGDKKPGWWDEMIGPGKAFDTDKYFVICSNVIGGCMGSTGPSSINPETQKPYALSFPIITIGDMVQAQRKLMEHLGIEKLLSVCGGSMGGMQALEWAVNHPEKVKSVIPIATTIKHSPQQIAFDEVGRQAIMADPNWQGGNYYGKEIPAKGLALARMIGHITYMSDKSMEKKFGRQIKDETKKYKFGELFEVESYLHYRGDNFVKRFDANSYLYITKAMDLYDAGRGCPFHKVLEGKNVKFLVIAFRSDWLYPIYQSQEIVKACKIAGLEATFCIIDSTYGHDAFLLEIDEESHLIKHFLKKVFEGKL